MLIARTAGKNMHVCMYVLCVYVCIMDVCMYVCMYVFLIYLLACSITLVISNTTCYLHLVFTIIVFFLLVNLLTVLLNAFMSSFL